MTDGPPPQRKRRWGLLVRAGIGVVIVALVVTRVPLHDLAVRLGHVRAADAALLLLVAPVLMSTGVMRWWRLLVRLGERPSLGAVCRDLLVGALFNTFLPTSFGGDVIRALRMGRRLEAPHRAWSTSLFERLVGLITMAIGSSVAVLFVVGDALPPRARYGVVGVALALGVGFFFASTPLKILVGILEKRIPSTFIQDVRGVATDLEGPLTRTSVRLETFAWSLAGLLVGSVYIYLGARALGAPEHGVSIVVGNPVVGILAIAPISLGGHGLREGLYVVVLGMLGVPKDVALGVGLCSLAYNVLFAALGGVVSLIEPAPKARASRGKTPGSSG